MATTEAAIWELIMRPHLGKMTHETAQTILGFSIPEAERVRMKELLAKAKEGTLSREEALDMDEFERMGTTLSILKAKARRVLKSKDG
jgi:hypothetical protein